MTGQPDPAAAPRSRSGPLRARRSKAPAAAADVPGLLAAARELLGSFGRGDPLVEACRVTRAVLDADFVVAFGTADGGATLRAEAQFGLTEERWHAYRVVELPAAIAERIRARAARSDVSVVDVRCPATGDADALRRSIARRMGIGPILLLALRAAGTLTGVMVACRETGRAPFDAAAVRVAGAFGPLLAASLENQRLLHRLEAANQAQREFLANMSHELRTPLNVITGYLDMLLDGLAGSLAPQQREICERIRRSAAQQLALVGEAFEISRRDSGDRLPVRREEVALTALVADLERETALRPARPGVRVAWVVDDLDVTVMSDPVKLRMIVRNLVDNALKFTERGEVRIRVALDDAVLTWRVEDTGSGIPASAREAIFEAFRQVGDGSTGLGLGLHIVRRLTDALGGTVEVESAEGRGSVFTVRIPVDVVSLRDERGR